MDTPITRAEHQEFARRQDEENKRQNKRIDELEETDCINKINRAAELRQMIGVENEG